MNVLLTGERQVGKTTVCRRVAELARGLGYGPAGVLTPVLLDKDGFPVVRHALMVSDGEQRLLAQANGDLGGVPGLVLSEAEELSNGGLRTGRYSFDADLFVWVIGRLRGAISRGCDLLIVDEIGPLELEQGRGLAPILPDLSAGTLPPLLLVVRPELTAQLQGRLPDIPFCTFTATRENRQALPGTIIKELLADHDRGR